jgi:RNA-directed DNA polymerase
MTERIYNLVLPLVQKATAMRTMETADSNQNVSSAVASLIGKCLRQSDVDSKTQRSTPQILVTPGIRTLKMATRITTTRTTSSGRELSADHHPRLSHNFSFEQLVKAYFDCRKHKRNTTSALLFEQNLEQNLHGLYQELITGKYQPGKSICFVITRPKPREVWAADFRDRIVHHLFYNHISPRFYASFITDSCACIPERGTLYAAKRLESKIRSATQNWSKPCFYLKCDLANFFVAIDKNILYAQLYKKITEPEWLWLAELILFHDPRLNYELRGNPSKLDLVPSHKKLTNHSADNGLPIGNLSSQFFANVYLNALDQFIKHEIKAKYYIRYVDDFVILHESAEWLNQALVKINIFLETKLNAKLNPTKTILQPVDRGVDFVGQVVKPWRRITRKRTINNAIHRIQTIKDDKLFETANSYFGLARQASKSHQEQAKIAKAILKRGHCVNYQLTKTFKISDRKKQWNKAS